MQIAQDLELALVFPEERETVAGGPLPASAINAASVTDAAKNGMEYKPQGGGSTWILVRKERKLVLKVNPEAIDHPVLQELTELLNLQPARDRYEIIVAADVADPLKYPSPPSPDLRITPRSTAQVYFYLANGVEVPPDTSRRGSSVRRRPRRRAVRYPGGHRRPLLGALLQGAQTTAHCPHRGQLSRLLVLHR